MSKKNSIVDQIFEYYNRIPPSGDLYHCGDLRSEESTKEHVRHFDDIHEFLYYRSHSHGGGIPQHLLLSLCYYNTLTFDLFGFHGGSSVLKINRCE